MDVADLYLRIDEVRFPGFVVAQRDDPLRDADSLGVFAARVIKTRDGLKRFCPSDANCRVELQLQQPAALPGSASVNDMAASLAAACDHQRLSNFHLNSLPDDQQFDHNLRLLSRRLYLLALPVAAPGPLVKSAVPANHTPRRRDDTTGNRKRAG